ncbi:MAG: LON peptidase substrate-binding domain-containing protein [Actinomycetota bacterium]
MADIGLFPLGIVVLPGERAALHIFETRYKDLINRCLDEQVEFGIVLADGAGMRKTGTTVAIVEVIERFEDGRLNIIIEGSDRFDLLEVKDERTYLTAATAPYPDTVELPPDTAYEPCLEEYRRVVAAAGLDLTEPIPDHRGLAFHLAAQIDLPLPLKQALLETRSETERLQRVQEVLEDAARGARRRQVERRASTNGHVQLPGQ